MPSLFRFVFFVSFIFGVGYAGLYILDKYFEPTPSETIHTVRGVKIRR